MRGHPGNLPVFDGHVHQPINVVLIIQHMAAAQQEVVNWGCSLGKSAKAGGKRERETTTENPMHRLPILHFSPSGNKSP
jgi:hypothetical protein